MRGESSDNGCDGLYGGQRDRICVPPRPQVVSNKTNAADADSGGVYPSIQSQDDLIAQREGADPEFVCWWLEQGDFVAPD